MEEKILDYVKERCGIDTDPENDVDAFDAELIQEISLSLSIVQQLGGIDNPIPDMTANTTWDELIFKEGMDKNLVKNYVAMKVKHQMFDISGSKYVFNMAEKILADTEYRITLLAIQN